MKSVEERIEELRKWKQEETKRRVERKKEELQKQILSNLSCSCKWQNEIDCWKCIQETALELNNFNFWSRDGSHLARSEVLAVALKVWKQVGA